MCLSCGETSIYRCVGGGSVFRSGNQSAPQYTFGEMFEDKPLRRIPLEMIRADERYQPRVEGLDEAHVESLVKDSDPEFWPPLIATPRDPELKEVPEGSDFEVNIVDGFHRLEAAERFGLPDVACRVVPGAGYEVAFLLNRAHGKMLTLEDKREYARWMRRENPVMSVMEISRRTGLHRNTVPAVLSNPVDAQNVQSTKGSRTSSDPLERVLKAIDKLFREDCTDEDMMRAVRGYLDGFEKEAAREIAADFALCGTSLLEAAEPYRRTD